MEGGRILVVDDEPSIVDAVGTALRYGGFEVREERTGRRRSGGKLFGKVGRERVDRSLALRAIEREREEHDRRDGEDDAEAEDCVDEDRVRVMVAPCSSLPVLSVFPPSM
jgi:hypothetical protein